MITEERNPAYMNPLDINSVSQCTDCPSLGRDHVPSYGSPQADLMIIGQSPGANEVEAEEPFVGQSGALVDLMLTRAELDREEVYIANALKCHPPDNRPGAPDELANCRKKWLKPEISCIHPTALLVLGKDAANALGIPNDKQVHGNVIRTKKMIYIFSYHPAYFLRKNDTDSFIQVGDLVKEALSND